MKATIYLDQVEIGRKHYTIATYRDHGLPTIMWDGDVMVIDFGPAPTELHQCSCGNVHELNPGGRMRVYSWDQAIAEGYLVPRD